MYRVQNGVEMAARGHGALRSGTARCFPQPGEAEKDEIAEFSLCSGSTVRASSLDMDGSMSLAISWILQFIQYMCYF